MDSKLKMEEDSLQGYDDDDDFDFEPETKTTRRRHGKKMSTGSNSGCPSSSRVRHKSGTASYADLITSAILSTNEARLSLAEIYDWMANNVPGLQSQRYLHSSKGWKNAVRHTLSINPRFHKIARMGRPSWWTVDVDSESPRLQHIVEVAQGYNNSSGRCEEPSSTCGVDLDEIYEPSNAEVELELFRARTGSEPVFAFPTLSLKRRNTVNLGDDKDEVDVKTSRYGGHVINVVNTGVQKVKVFQDDGKTVLVTIKTPIHLKTTTSEDCGTQTEDETTTSTTILNQAITPTMKTDDNWSTTGISSPWLPTFAAELAPSLSDSGFHTLTTLTEDCALDMTDSWQELRLDQSDLDAINHAFTTGWLTEDNIQA